MIILNISIGCLYKVSLKINRPIGPLLCLHYPISLNFSYKLNIRTIFAQNPVAKNRY